MFLNFNILLQNYIHISNIRKLNKKNSHLYKIVNNSYIINLVYTSIYLYKLYKILFLLSRNKIYITIINTSKLNTTKFIYYLTKFTRSNCFNHRWIHGSLTNITLIPSLIIIHIFITKLHKSILKSKNRYNIKNIKIKYNFLKYLKNTTFSKFIFFLNLDLNMPAIKESLIKNKFIMGVCDLNFNTNLTDIYIYGNNVNHKSINFFLKFIITPLIQGENVKYKRKLTKNNKNSDKKYKKTNYKKKYQKKYTKKRYKKNIKTKNI
uniref:Ribosomal protein S2 n=1 Tax=Babesia sp. Dunhuang TaxID=1164853 RepID=A0A411AD68_9APIC|nr:ribosomal protein S2 [Babesia sp. Xinjiang]QAX26993.1 ribosomal protein S2 [Babesia sp. Xinjiang]QAX27024.1 ribosomal protein S2 [Babesia sp. Dunhuang]